MSILMASRTAERLTWKSAAHFASFGRMVPGGNSPRTMLRPIASAIETWILPRPRGRIGTDGRTPADPGELAGLRVVLIFSLAVSLRMSLFQFAIRPQSVKGHSQDDKAANESALPKTADSQKRQAVADYFDKGGADHRAKDGAGAAHQIGAANDSRGDDTQLH